MVFDCSHIEIVAGGMKAARLSVERLEGLPEYFVRSVPSLIPRRSATGEHYSTSTESLERVGDNVF